MDMMWYRRRGLMVTPHVERVTGAIASFNSAYNKIPVKSLICNIYPIQEGTGDPSPENVRPISGRTGLTVSHSGSDTNDPTTISVNWETEAGTVYGGMLDVVSGKLMVDRAKVVFDGTQTIGNASWRDLEDSSAWLYRPEITPGIENIQGGSGVVSDKLPSISYNSLYSGGVGISLLGTSYAIGMRVPISGLTTAALINAWLSENPITVVYKLATPTEIQLTGQEIRTLLGENNIWCDSGDVSVDYWKWGN